MQSDPTPGGVVFTASSVSQSEHALLAQGFVSIDRTDGDLGRSRTRPDASHSRRPSDVLFDPLSLPAQIHAAARFSTTLSEQ
jgi:hypothetical protein